MALRLVFDTAAIREKSSRQTHVATQVDLEAEFGEHGGFDAAGAVGLFFVWSVDDLDMV